MSAYHPMATGERTCRIGRFMPGGDTTPVGSEGETNLRRRRSTAKNFLDLTQFALAATAVCYLKSFTKPSLVELNF
jgi:hypothetical protein